MRACVSRYSPAEVARATGLCVETVRRAIRAGRLATIRSPSGYYHVTTLADVADWLRTYSPTPSRRVANPPHPSTESPPDDSSSDDES